MEAMNLPPMNEYDEKSSDNSQAQPPTVLVAHKFILKVKKEHRILLSFVRGKLLNMQRVCFVDLYKSYRKSSPIYY